MATIAEEDQKKKSSFGDAAAAAQSPAVAQVGAPRLGMSSQIPNSAPEGWAGGTGEKVSGNDFSRALGNTAQAVAPLGFAAAGAAKVASAVPGMLASPAAQTALAYGAPTIGAIGLGMAASKTSQPAPAAISVTPMPPSSAAMPAANAAATQAVVTPANQSASAPDGSPLDSGTGNLSSSERMAMDARAHESAMQGIKLKQQLMDGGAPAPGGFQPPQIRNASNDWQAAKDLQNLQTAASSITAQGSRRGGPSVAQAAYLKAFETDQALKQGNDPSAIAAIHENAATVRANTQEQGQNTRFGMTHQLAQQKGAMEQAKFGFDAQSAAQVQSAQRALMSAKTPEARQTAMETLAGLQGKYSPKDSPNKFTVVPGGQAIDNKTGLAYTVPGRVLDNQSGRFVDDGQSMPKNPANDKNAVAIRDNAALSREQKLAQLKALGY